MTEASRSSPIPQSMFFLGSVVREKSSSLQMNTQLNHKSHCKAHFVRVAKKESSVVFDGSELQKAWGPSHTESIIFDPRSQNCRHFSKRYIFRGRGQGFHPFPLGLGPFSGLNFGHPMPGAKLFLIHFFNMRSVGFTTQAQDSNKNMAPNYFKCFFSTNASYTNYEGDTKSHCRHVQCSNCS